jgi:hypothetical protein
MLTSYDRARFTGGSSSIGVGGSTTRISIADGIFSGFEL